MKHSSEDPAVVEAQPGMKPSAAIRCLLALLCSHLGAPYAAARVTIRLLLDGSVEETYAAIATVAIVAGAALAFRQLVNQSAVRRLLCGAIALALWFAFAVVMLRIAVDSAIPQSLLSLLWGIGTFWVMWLVWGLSFFRWRGFAVGAAVAVIGAVCFWNLVDITGLTGDAKVEFAWRKSQSRRSTLAKTKVAESLGKIKWGGYLGTDRSGNVDRITLNENWEENPPEEVWRTECGLGWSSFAATETTLFGQEQHNSEDCVVARSAETGELIWFVSEERDGFHSVMGGDGPRATPTLTTMQSETGDEVLVLLAAGPTGMVACLNATDGNPVWKTDVAKLFPGDNLAHGVCASPLVLDHLVIVCPSAPGSPCAVALNLRDGELVWKCDSDWRSSYASPQLMSFHSLDQIVLHAGPGVIALTPSDGHVLWSFEFSNEWDNNATQPAAIPDSENHLVIATGYRGGAARLSLLPNEDGTMVAKEIWRTTSTMKTKFCNVSIFDNALVGLDNGILCGVDIATGKRLWKNGRYGHGQTLKVGKYLLVIEERGGVHLLQPNAQGHNPLGSAIALDRKTWNHPILVGDRLIVRNDQEIVCLRLPLLESLSEAIADTPIEESLTAE